MKSKLLRCLNSEHNSYKVAVSYQFLQNTAIYLINIWENVLLKTDLSFLMRSVQFVSLEILSQSSETEFRREDVRGGVIVEGGVVLVLTFALLLRLNLLSSVVPAAADFTRFSLSLRLKFMPLFLYRTK